MLCCLGMNSNQVLREDIIVLPSIPPTLSYIPTEFLKQHVFEVEYLQRI